MKCPECGEQMYLEHNWQIDGRWLHETNGITLCPRIELARRTYSGSPAQILDQAITDDSARAVYDGIFKKE